MLKMIYAFTLSLFCLIIPSIASAQSTTEFSTSFTSIYTIKQNGQTHVEHQIQLTNNLSHIYATSYSVATSGDHLKGITVRDETGALDTQTSIQDGITTIHFVFQTPAIGKDQRKTITLSYDTDDVVEQIGSTKTINIPRLSRANEASAYKRVVRIEGEGDQPQHIYPPPSQVQAEDGYATFTFIGHQNDSLTLLFGDSVTYHLNLTYELKNKELSSITSELALPPDTGYQSVILNSITPAPESIVLDQNGNWMARYALKPQETLKVEAELYLTVYPTPTSFDPSSTKLPKTTSSKYWDASAPVVKDLATQLKTPQNIYAYLVNNFSYNYAGLNNPSDRLGATSALSSENSVLCTEFTDAFVALTRSNEIPSRAIFGYGYTKNLTLQPQNTQADILHAWPEYYHAEMEKWISVDPTWGNTTGGIDYFSKLDFSHLTFVRLGSEDSYPLPAGAYKSNALDRHLQVEVAENPVEPKPSYLLKQDQGQVTVTNNGNVALVNQTIKLDQGEYHLVYLPPYGSQTFDRGDVLSLWHKLKAFFAKLATWITIR